MPTLSRLLPTLIFAFTLLADPDHAPATQAEGPPPAAVVFHGQGLFLGRTRVGSFSPEARARAIAERLDRVSRDVFGGPPELQRSAEHRLLVDAAATEGVLLEPAPFLLQTSLDDFFVSYQINAYTDQPARMADTYSQFHANIQECFNAARVEIMSPHYRAEQDGNPSTIPNLEGGS